MAPQAWTGILVTCPTLEFDLNRRSFDRCGERDTIRNDTMGEQGGEVRKSQSKAPTPTLTAWRWGQGSEQTSRPKVHEPSDQMALIDAQLAKRHPIATFPRKIQAVPADAGGHGRVRLTSFGGLCREVSLSSQV